MSLVQRNAAQGQLCQSTQLTLPAKSVLQAAAAAALKWCSASQHAGAGSSKKHLTYPLLLFYALWDHGSVLAIQQLHKDVVLPSPLQLRSVDDLQTCNQALALGDAVWIHPMSSQWD